MPHENVSWTHFMLGEQLFQTGDLSAAEKEEAVALQCFPGYHRALAEMGRIRAAQHRSEEAIDYYKQALNIIPLPTYAAALGDLYQNAATRQMPKSSIPWWNISGVSAP